MKHAFLFLILLLFQTSFVQGFEQNHHLSSCADFSGLYTRVSDAEDVEIIQKQCEEIIYNIFGQNYKYKTDGREHLIAEYNIEGADDTIIARVKIYQTREHKNDRLYVEGRSITEYTESQNIEESKALTYFEIDSEHNIKSITKYDDGSEFEETYLRITH